MERIKRLFPNTEESFFLFGPRGTGKTTWLKEHYQDALFIDLLLDRYYYRFQFKKAG